MKRLALLALLTGCGRSDLSELRGESPAEEVRSAEVSDVVGADAGADVVAVRLDVEAPVPDAVPAECTEVVPVCHSNACLKSCSFALPFDPGSSLRVYINNALQAGLSYTVDGRTLTLTGGVCSRWTNGAVWTLDVVRGCAGVWPEPWINQDASP